MRMINTDHNHLRLKFDHPFYLSIHYAYAQDSSQNDTKSPSSFQIVMLLWFDEIDSICTLVENGLNVNTWTATAFDQPLLYLTLELHYELKAQEDCFPDKYPLECTKHQHTHPTVTNLVDRILLSGGLPHDTPESWAMWGKLLRLARYDHPLALFSDVDILFTSGGHHNLFGGFTTCDADIGSKRHRLHR